MRDDHRREIKAHERKCAYWRRIGVKNGLVHWARYMPKPHIERGGLSDCLPIYQHNRWARYKDRVANA